MKRLAIAVLALVCTMTLARSAYAETEFGIQDDLTVIGDNGGVGDADLEVAGFSVFGPRLATSALLINDNTAGNTVINGQLQAGDLYIVNGSSVILGTQSFIKIPTMPLFGNQAANKDYVDLKTMTEAIWAYDDATNKVRLSTVTASVGIGIDQATAKLQANVASPVADDKMFLVSGGALGSDEFLGIDALDENSAKAGLHGQLAIGSGYSAAKAAPTDGMAVQGAISVGAVSAGTENGNKLAVVGVDAPGKYIATFYSGSNIAAFIRAK